MSDKDIIGMCKEDERRKKSQESKRKHNIPQKKKNE